MKIVIIGAKGLLGQELARVFADQHPFLWDKEELDLADFKFTKQRLLAAKPDIIINAAAYNDVDRAESEKDLAMLINGEAVGNLAVLANKQNAILVHYSTEYIFDGSKREGYREEDKPAPLSVYGQSKLKGEQEAALAARHYIIRLSRLFGRSGAGKKSFVEKILDKVKTDLQAKALDEEVSCPTYALDLALRTRFILENNIPTGIYHCPNYGGCTWYELARETLKIKRIAIELERVSSAELNRAAKRPAFGILLNTKLPPMRPWQEALREFLNWNFSS